MTKKDIKLSGMSFFIGLTMLFALAQAMAQQEVIAIDHDLSTPITNNQFTTARPPSHSLYNGNWDTETVTPENLTIPFYNQQLKIIVSQPESPFFFPCWGNIIQDVVKKGKKMHYGIDIQINENDPVVASFDGTVRLVRQFDQYGKTVIIRHYNGLETIYSHLGSIIVIPGQPVEAGTVIGAGGNEEESGFLHFETRFLHHPFDPLLFIDKESHKILGDTLTLTPEEMISITPSTTSTTSTTKTQTTTSVLSSGGNYHVVKQGDTLYKISRMYNISVEKILQLNHMRENDIISIGQKIKIK